MRLFVLVAAIELAAMPCGFAQPAAVDESTQAALDLEQVTGGAQAIQRTLNRLQPALVREVMQGSHMSIGEASARVATIQPEIQKHIPELLRAEARIYAKHLTLRDIQAMTAFYRSDAGRDMLAQQAAIVSDTVAAMQPMIKDIEAEEAAMAKQRQQATQPAAPSSP